MRERFADLSKPTCAEWRQEKTDEALEIFRMMLELNPNDNQGIRFIIPAIKAGKSWEEFMKEEEEE